MILFFCERFYISLKTNWLISNQIDISLLAKTQWANKIKQSNGSPRWDTDSKIKWIKIAAYKILFGGKFNCQRQYLNGWQWDFFVFHLSHWPYDIYANVEKIYESHQNRNAMFKHYDGESTGWCYCHLSTYERHSERKQMLTHRCVHIYIYIAASCWWCAENIRKEKFFVFRWMKFVMRICVFWVIWPKISNYNCLMQRSHSIGISNARFNEIEQQKLAIPMKQHRCLYNLFFGVKWSVDFWSHAVRCTEFSCVSTPLCHWWMRRLN